MNNIFKKIMREMGSRKCNFSNPVLPNPQKSVFQLMVAPRFLRILNYSVLKKSVTRVTSLLFLLHLNKNKKTYELPPLLKLRNFSNIGFYDFLSFENSPTSYVFLFHIYLDTIISPNLIG